MQPEGLTLSVEFGFIFIASKDPPTFRLKDVLFNQLIDAITGFKGWVELNQRFWPEDTLIQTALDVVFNARILNVDEAVDVCAVFVNQAVAEVEDIHGDLEAIVASCGNKKADRYRASGPKTC